MMMLLSGDHVTLGKSFFVYYLEFITKKSYYCYKENTQTPLDILLILRKEQLKNS